MGDSRADLFRMMFLEEAGELLGGLEQGLAGLDSAAPDRARLDQLYRAAHSLKGAAAMVGFAEISEMAREMEQALARVRTGGAAWSGELHQTLSAQRGRLGAAVASLAEEGDSAGE